MMDFEGEIVDTTLPFRNSMEGLIEEKFFRI
jgi:hypothetical protein